MSVPCALTICKASISVLLNFLPTLPFTCHQSLVDLRCLNPIGPTSWTNRKLWEVRPLLTLLSKRNNRLHITVVAEVVVTFSASGLWVYSSVKTSRFLHWGNCTNQSWFPSLQMESEDKMHVWFCGSSAWFNIQDSIWHLVRDLILCSQEFSLC